MDVVDAICTGAEPTDDNGTIAADAQPVITSITIREVEEIEDNGNAEGTAASEGTQAKNAARNNTLAAF